ncbi:MAG: peptidoglycan -binding protein [Rhodospirillales bacterium]|nr:peptidoglycan -binding protein [Rhodospirillales bacterium]
MSTSSRRRRSSASPDIWPGFVDALATLLMVIIFLLTVFVLAQFFLSDQLAGRDQALRRLEINITELSQMLALEREAGAELRSTVTRLSGELQSSNTNRDQLRLRLSQMQATAEQAARDAQTLKDQLASALTEVTAGKETIRLRLLEVASLKADIESLRNLRKKLETQVGQMAADLKNSETEAGLLRDRSKKLETRLADSNERTLLAQTDLKARDLRIETLSAQELAQRSQVTILNEQIAALRNKLARISEALKISEAATKEQKVQIVNLGKRLNEALVNKVEELAQYRSEFFGKLRKVLGEKSGIRIVGDRFVFQSEVLFSSGDAALNDAGKSQIKNLARTLKDITPKIPAGIDWILRVDGHTDVRPIKTRKFPSNWELSTARALSVVRFLIKEGIPPLRLAATGFGPYQPLVAGTDQKSYRRNRRIELKFTQR